MGLRKQLTRGAVKLCREYFCGEGNREMRRGVARNKNGRPRGGHFYCEKPNYFGVVLVAGLAGTPVAPAGRVAPLGRTAPGEAGPPAGLGWAGTPDCAL